MLGGKIVERQQLFEVVGDLGDRFGELLILSNGPAADDYLLFG
jgi:hypothetical protein